MIETRGFARIARAIDFLTREAARQPSMEEAAAVAVLSPEHFSREFRKHVGVSPKRFLQQLTLEALKQRLAAGAAVLDAQLDVGLSSLARVHDHFVHLEAVTPGEYRRQGTGLEIRYGFHAGPCGEMLLATTLRGLCFLAFTEVLGRAIALDELARSWPRAGLVEDADASRPYAQHLAAPTGASDVPLSLHVRGTNFQIQVWRALLRIPPGALVTYTALARAAGSAQSVRAAASAVGANPVSLVIPCHRVIRKSGALGGYRWSEAIKSSLLVREALAASTPRAAGGRRVGAQTCATTRGT